MLGPLQKNRFRFGIYHLALQCHYWLDSRVVLTKSRTKRKGGRKMKVFGWLCVAIGGIALILIIVLLILKLRKKDSMDLENVNKYSPLTVEKQN